MPTFHRSLSTPTTSNEEMTKLESSLPYLLRDSLSEKEKLQKIERDFLAKIRRIELEANNTAKQLRDLIDKHERLVSEQLDFVKQENMKQIQTRHLKIDQQLWFTLNDTRISYNQIRTEKLTTDIYRTESDLQLRIDELKEWRIRSLQSCRGLDDASLQSTENDKKNIIRSIEGEISIIIAEVV